MAGSARSAGRPTGSRRSRPPPHGPPPERAMGKVARRKVLRDLWLARGRTAVLVFAMAISLTAVGAVLGAYGILVREMPRSFLSSNPASATLVVHEGVESGLLQQIRQRPGIADAERRGMVFARVEVAPETWLPLRLFVVDDFDAMRIETITLLEGAWPPTAGTMLIERTSLELLAKQVGAAMLVSPQGGQLRPLQVAGVVFDGGVAPA